MLFLQFLASVALQSENSANIIEVGTVRNIVRNAVELGHLPSKRSVSNEIGRFPIAIYLPSGDTKKTDEVLAELTGGAWVESASGNQLKWSQQAKHQIDKLDRETRAIQVASALQAWAKGLKVPESESDINKYLSTANAQAENFLEHKSEDLKLLTPIVFVARSLALAESSNFISRQVDFDDVAYSNAPSGIQQRFPESANSAVELYGTLFQRALLHPSIRSALEQNTSGSRISVNHQPTKVVVHVSTVANRIGLTSNSYDNAGIKLDHWIENISFYTPAIVELTPSVRRQLEATEVRSSQLSKSLAKCLIEPDYVLAKRSALGTSILADFFDSRSAALEKEIWEPYLADIVRSISEELAPKGVAVLADDSWLKLWSQCISGADGASIGELLSALRTSTSVRIWIKDGVLYIRPRLLGIAADRNCDRSVLASYVGSVFKRNTEDFREYCMAIAVLGKSGYYGSFGAVRKLLAQSGVSVLQPTPSYLVSSALGAMPDLAFNSLLDGRRLHVDQFGIAVLPMRRVVRAAWSLFERPPNEGGAISDESLDVSGQSNEIVDRIAIGLERQVFDGFLQTIATGQIDALFARPQTKFRLVEVLAKDCKLEDLAVGGRVGETPVTRCEASNWLLGATLQGHARAQLADVSLVSKTSEVSTKVGDLPKDLRDWIWEELRKRIAFGTL